MPKLEPERRRVDMCEWKRVVYNPDDPIILYSNGARPCHIVGAVNIEKMLLESSHFYDDF